MTGRLLAALQDVPVPPTPPPPPDFPGPEFFSGPGEWVPIVGMLTGVVITAMFVIGPIGRAIGDVIRHWLGGGRRDEKILPADVDELLARLDQVQHQVGELAERLDFAERMLAQARKEKALPGGADVTG